MKCWICGDNANSGEHRIKASDLKSLFGHVTQKAPLYFHTDVKRNQPVAGIKSNKLKYSAPICARCNNERTQPHDRAWEQLSSYLRTRQPAIRPGDLVRLNRPFPGNVGQSMLGVHLFFVKLFGCLIVEHSIPLDIGPLSQSILHNKPHPNVWLAFCIGLQNPSIKHAGCSQVETVQLDGRIAYARWFYVVDRLAVKVIYAEPSVRHRSLVHAWHPSSIGKRVRVVGQ